MPDQTIYIGGKPPMNYVLAVVTQFNTGSPIVILKARGRAISRAVDVAEIVRNRFIQGLKYPQIRISSESVTDETGKERKVSSIEIALSK
jgi:DNA-binding protein